MQSRKHSGTDDWISDVDIHGPIHLNAWLETCRKKICDMETRTVQAGNMLQTWPIQLTYAQIKGCKKIQLDEKWFEFQSGKLFHEVA